MLPNPANTVESWWRNCRSLVANSRPRPRYSDIEEVQIARMGSIHTGFARCSLPFAGTRATRREDARHGRGSRGYDTSHDPTFSSGAAPIPSGKPGVGQPNSGVKLGVMTP